MADMTTEIARSRANDDKRVEKFTGGVRSIDTPNLELGDTFTFPTEYEVYLSQTFGQYIFVTLENGGAVKKFFPSLFTKSRAVYAADVNGRPRPILENGQQKRVKTEGTAAIEFRKYTEIEKAMDALKGKKVKITKVECHKTLDYNNPGRLRNTEFLTIDFVD